MNSVNYPILAVHPFDLEDEDSPGDAECWDD